MGFASVTQFLGGLAFFLTIGAVAVVGEAFTWLYELDWFNIIGMSGMILLVISYTLLQLGKVHTGLNYSILNLIAAVMLAISLTKHFNMASMFIEVFWITMSIYGIWKGLKEKREKRIAQIRRDWEIVASTPGVQAFVSTGFYMLDDVVVSRGSLWRLVGEPAIGQRGYPAPGTDGTVWTLAASEWDATLQYTRGDEALCDGHIWTCTKACINERPHHSSSYWYCPALKVLEGNLLPT